MLFRDISGNLIELNRYDFINDKLYYQKIIEIKTKITKSVEVKKSNYSNYIIQLLTKVEEK
jgi:hypothetical protein